MSPDSVYLLLTGCASVEGAIAPATAVPPSRFLAKPISKSELVEAQYGAVRNTG